MIPKIMPLTPQIIWTEPNHLVAKRVWLESKCVGCNKLRKKAMRESAISLT